MKQLVFSIIMPSYNSEKTIEIALKSIKMQNFDQNRIEILVIDGGSTDATLDIARHYGAVILENPDKLPEFAKRIGFMHAQGQYALEMDSDEEFLYPDQLSKRYRLLQKYPQVACMTVDKVLPAKGYGICCSYLCTYGDPFTFFVLRLKGGWRRTFRRNIDCREPSLMHFNDADSKPIGDGGTALFSMDAVHKHVSQKEISIDFVTAAFNHIISQNGYCGCIEDDNIRHYSAASMKTYLAKLRFRIINNVYHKKESGFSVREASSPMLTRRKWIFPLYALSLVFPLFDSIRLALRHKDASMLLHFFYVYYLCVFSAGYLLLKIFGGHKKSSSYAK